MGLVLQEEKKPPAQPTPPAGVPAWAGWAPPCPLSPVPDLFLNLEPLTRVAVLGQHRPPRLG